MLAFVQLIAQEASGCTTSYCQFRGIAAVAIAVLVFMGGPILVLGTNVGFRKATAIVLAALFGYLTIHGFLWVFYPRGPLVTHKVLGLSLSLSSRIPAFLLMTGSGLLMLVLCVALNRLDRTNVEEQTLKE